MDEVWVALTWSAHGEGTAVQGVYESREAAFECLKGEPNMTVYVGEDGFVHGRPKVERLVREWPRWGWGVKWVPEKWAVATPEKVRRRAPVTQAE